MSNSRKISTSKTPRIVINPHLILKFTIIAIKQQAETKTLVEIFVNLAVYLFRIEIVSRVKYIYYM